MRMLEVVISVSENTNFPPGNRNNLEVFDVPMNLLIFLIILYLLTNQQMVKLIKFN